MSRAGDFLNESDFDNNDMGLLKRRMSMAGGAPNSEIHKLALQRLADACDVFEQISRLLDNIIGGNPEDLDDLILLTRNKAAVVIEMCDAVDDAFAEETQDMGGNE